MADSSRGLVVRVRPDQPTDVLQRLPYFVGVSGNTAGASGLSLSLVIIPPGGRAEPHRHLGYETAIYVIEGSVETRFGEGLRETVVTDAGDFLFIAPDVPHQPVNLSDSSRAVAVVARNDPAEQERTVPYESA